MKLWPIRRSDYVKSCRVSAAVDLISVTNLFYVHTQSATPCILIVLETLYSGETILLIFPDGTGPALLSAMIAGIPLNRVHELEYQHGELRMNISKESTLKILKEKEKADGKVYEETLITGGKELARLRDTTNMETLSLKDQKLEEDQKEIDKLYQEGQDAIRVEKELELARRQNMQTAGWKEREERLFEVSGNNNGGLLSNSNPIIAASAAFGSVGLAGIFAASGGEKQSTTEEGVNDGSNSPPPLTEKDDKQNGNLFEAYLHDGLTKVLGWVLHSRHARRMMGHFLNSIALTPILLI